MGNFIDRNPEEMVRYSKKAKDVIGEMIFIIRKIEGILEYSAPALDDVTQEKINKLHNCCNEYFKQIDVYQSAAESIYKKGISLSTIREEG